MTAKVLCDILRKIEDPFLQYNCLQEIISSQAIGGKKAFAHGTVNISAPETATIGNANQVVLPPSLYQLYVELLCRFDPASILGFLKEHDGYSLDNCLNICKEKDVIDATAYLLERTGNIEDALKMLLKFLRVCLTKLLSLDGIFVPVVGILEEDMLSQLEGVKEYSKIKETLETLVGMLAENKSIGNALWFDVLDIFLNEQRNVETGTSGSYSKKAIISKLIKRLYQQ